SVTTEHEEGVRQQILGGLIADKGGRSFFCSPNQYSIVKFFPSIHSSSRSSCRNASTRAALPEAVLASRNPIRGRPTPHRRACRPYGFSPSSTVPHCHPVRASAGPPGSRAWSFPTCLGSLTPRCRRTARAYRCPSCCLPRIKTRSAHRSGDFGAPYLACAYPCQRFARILSDPGA